MKHFFFYLLLIAFAYSCKSEEQSTSGNELVLGDGSVFYSSCISSEVPHYVVHSTKDCPEIKDGILVNHYTSILDEEFYCQTCMDDSLIATRQKKEEEYYYSIYPLYCERILTGTIPYIKLHTQRNCPAIKEGVTCGNYHTSKEFNSFCAKCVPGHLMERFMNDNFPTKK